ncbi:MAG: hypothetical protein LBF09_04495 [Odoribacteraceae bacterium]|jgi:hypothetical protein|nr:hypothetical protein [Odoribacteraceae bacterium]
MNNVSGKWKYKEEYDHGAAAGELLLEQNGALLSGRIIFTDRSGDGDTCMIREDLSGTLEGRKVKLKATELDVIHAEHEIDYELDEWFGLLVDECTIIGLSMDEQGIEGHFTFERE